jgi:hypothetical protein
VSLRLNGSLSLLHAGYLTVMNEYATRVHLTPSARELLRSDEVLILEWHRLAVCCAGAGETSLSVMKEKPARKRKGLVRLKTNGAEDNPPIYAARAIFPHVAGWEINIDARKVLGIRFFTTDLPRDFGLRSIFGRLPRPQ